MQCTPCGAMCIQGFSTCTLWLVSMSCSVYIIIIIILLLYQTEQIESSCMHNMYPLSPGCAMTRWKLKCQILIIAVHHGPTSVLVMNDRTNSDLRISRGKLSANTTISSSKIVTNDGIGGWWIWCILNNDYN